MRKMLVPLLVGCGLVLPGGLEFADSPAWGQSATPRHTTVLTEDFEGPPQGDWSHAHTQKTPLGKNTFLGEFGAQAVTLALHDLPTHKLLRVNFDLYVIRSWDGSQVVFGPDIWQLSLVNGPTLLRTTFNNCRRVGSDQQAYPDNFPCPPHPCWTGAVAYESLGFTYIFKRSGTVPMDAVYRIRAVVPHSGAVAGLQFAAFYNDKMLDNQSWGIDNLEVQIVDDFETLSEEQFRQDWESLADDDPIRANEALWRLVAAGDNATRAIVQALHLEDPQQAGPAPADLSPSEAWQLRRAKRTLGIIDTPRARRALWVLSEPGKFETNDQQYLQTQLKCD